MIGKKDTLAIFESYQTYLKEQDEGLMGLIEIVANLTNLRDERELIPEDDLTKLIFFLRRPEMINAYKAFKVPPYKIDAGAMEGGGITSSEGDASAANMGEGGVLEVQPDGQYSR